MRSLIGDLRDAARLLWRTPAFTIVAIAGLLILTSVAATLVPARRAARLDRIAALRGE